MLLSSYSLGFDSPFYCLRDLRLVYVNFEDEVYNIPIVASPDLPQLCSLKQLEVQVHTGTRQSLLFFTSLIKPSPQLRDFRIEVHYSKYSSYLIVPLIESVSIDTETDYYDLHETGRHLTEIVATTRNEAKERARHFVSSFPKQIEAIVI
ncbi:hypothetical protein SASPL_106873 [Salvia splendens]|uniref:Uncharacterized protein n=1 Tax=Salvia splendens TaxID=180675 RepID=A0A8X9A6S1_SALSN|nr:hypothetical protein SASPL_106873 [Salvia splendens]